MLTFSFDMPRPRRGGYLAYVALLLLGLLAGLPRPARAQLPAWVAASSITTTSQYSFFQSTSAIDANGDVVVAGTFQSTLTFGTLPTLTARSFSDMYVAKMDGRTHQWLWAVRGGGNGADNNQRVTLTKLVVDAAGDITIGGSYIVLASFGSLPVLTSNNYNSYSANTQALVVKLAGSTGTWLWATGSSGLPDGAAGIGGLALDNAGNAMVVGSIGTTAQLGNLPPVTSSLGNYFTARIAAGTGQWQWLKQFSLGAGAVPSDIVVEATGKVAIAGYFVGSFTLAGLPTVLGNGYRNFFVAKLDPTTDQWLWAARTTASNTSAYTYSYPAWLKLTPTGDLLLAGYIDKATFQFGSLPLVTGSAAVLAKLDGSAGTWQWVQGVPNISAYSGVAFDAAGAIVAAGSFVNTVQFGPAVSLTSRGSQDIFVSKLAAATGQVAWATRAGGTGPEVVHSVVPTSGGDFLLTGTFVNQTDFGTLPTIAGIASIFGNEFASTYLARLSTSQLAVTDFTPARNAFAAPVAGPVDVGYTQPLAAATTPAIRVFGDLRRGYKPGVVSSQSTGGLAANALRFTPATPFSPNELLHVTVAGAAASAGGPALPAWVYQFRAAAGGPGRGLFSGGTNSAGAWQSALLATGDLDGDGDLDIISAGPQGTGFTPGLNDGTGNFTAAAGFAARGTSMALALADVDADGDLDVVWGAHYPGSDSVLVRFNTGSGSFGGLAKVAVAANPRSLAFGDLDADGDLDLVVASYQAAGGVSVCFNNGTGIFSGTGTVGMGAATYGVAVGDVDNDGDLDLLATNESAGTITTAFNTGAGSFGAAVTTAAGTLPHDVALLDLDKDGDLDFVAASTQAGVAAFVLGTNNGTGQFTTTFFSVGPMTVNSFALADIDADGDFDLLALDQAAHIVRTWVYGGLIIFSRTQVNTISAGPVAFVVGDLDGDGDVDWVSANSNGALAPYFNTGVALATLPAAAAALVAAVYPNPAHQQVTISLPPRTPSVQLTLTNSLGQRVLQRVASPKPDNSLVLDLSTLTPGIYYLHISADGLNVSKALVVE